MSGVISDLWYGNINLCDRTLGKGTRMAELVGQIAETQETLYSRLNQAEKALIEEFADYTAEMDGISEHDAFVSGFKHGTRIIIEVLAEA